MGSSSQSLKELKQAFREAWKKNYPRDSQTREAASLKVCHHLLEQSFFISAPRIALFCGLDHELNLLPLFELYPRSYAFPKVMPNKELAFFEVRSPEDLRPGVLKILEPLPTGHLIENWGSNDLFLVPGYAFDRKGTRIGTGAGYYDRFFAQNPQPQRWGISFHQQFHDQELAHTHHDVRMGAIVTEQGFFVAKKGT